MPRTSLIALLTIGLLASGCTSISRQLLYKPGAPPEALLTTDVKPSIVTAQTEDGLSLKGFHWPSSANDRDVVIFFHGRNWNASRSANAARHLTTAGNAVIVASYRGFDDNPGRATQAGLMEDARAFIRLALEFTGPDARIWLIGHSLGAAVALNAAIGEENVKAVFMLSPFARIADAAPRITRAFIPDDWDNVTAIPAMQQPVIIMQGGRDRFIPALNGDALFSRTTGPASLIIGEETRHNPDMALIAPWINAVIDSLETPSLQTLPPPPKGWVEKVRRP